jgi:hypothetical protein
VIYYHGDKSISPLGRLTLTCFRPLIKPMKTIITLTFHIVCHKKLCTKLQGIAAKKHQELPNKFIRMIVSGKIFIPQTISGKTPMQYTS